MKTYALVASTFLLAARAAHAEAWPTLEEYVRRCSLIVVCEADFEGDKPRWKVVETWKGKFDLENFNSFLQKGSSAPNYLPQGFATDIGRKQRLKQKCVLFFTGDPKEHPYNGATAGFDVREGKLIYAETGNPGMPKEYTLKDFKAAIEKIIASQSTKK